MPLGDACIGTRVQCRRLFFDSNFHQRPSVIPELVMDEENADDGGAVNSFSSTVIYSCTLHAHLAHLALLAHLERHSHYPLQMQDRGRAAHLSELSDCSEVR